MKTSKRGHAHGRQARWSEKLIRSPLLPRLLPPGVWGELNPHRPIRYSKPQGHPPPPFQKKAGAGHSRQLQQFRFGRARAVNACAPCVPRPARARNCFRDPQKDTGGRGCQSCQILEPRVKKGFAHRWIAMEVDPRAKKQK